MWRYVRLNLLVIVLVIGVCQGLLIVGPKFIHAGQKFKLVLSNFGSQSNDVTLRISGKGDSGGNILKLSKAAKVEASSSTELTLDLPHNLTNGNYTFTIDGQNGFKFHQEAELMFLASTLSGLVQLNKPIFKPGDTVQFRVIVLNNELRPPAGPSATAHVTVRDPHGNVIRRWTEATLRTGVFEGELQIATIPIIGPYTISVTVGGHEIGSKTFEVKEYALALFNVELQPRRVPLAKDQALSLTLTAQYYVGKPVKGTATIELYLEDDLLDQRKVLNVYGVAQLELKFNDYLNVYGTSQDVRLNVTFTQDETNHTIFKQKRITVYESPYQVELVQVQPEFDAGKPYSCALQLQYQDGTPATAVSAQVQIDGIREGTKQTTYTSDSTGSIKLLLRPEASTEMIFLSVTIDGIELLAEQINKREAGKAFIKLELISKVVVGEDLKFRVTSNKELPQFLYYVLSKGKILSSGYVKNHNTLTEYEIKISGTDRMVPKAHVMVATMSGNVVLYDFVDVSFNDLRNNFELKVASTTVEPGKTLEINMRGRPGAYVALAAYDKSLLQHSSNHDLFWQDIVNVVDGFSAMEYNEFDHFHVRTGWDKNSC